MVEGVNSGSGSNFDADSLDEDDEIPPKKQKKKRTVNEEHNFKRILRSANRKLNWNSEMDCDDVLVEREEE